MDLFVNETRSPSKVQLLTLTVLQIFWNIEKSSKMSFSKWIVIEGLGLQKQAPRGFLSERCSQSECGEMKTRNNYLVGHFSGSGLVAFVDLDQKELFQERSN